MRRALLISTGLSLLATGCFPDLPACDDGCVVGDTDATAGPGATETTPTPTAGDSGTDTVDATMTASGTDSTGTNDDTATDTGVDPPQGCSAPFTPLSWDAKTNTVSNDFFALTFDAEDSGVAPGEWTLGCGSNSNILFDGDQIERRLGFATWPDWNSLQEDIVMEVWEAGPAVVRLALTWEVDADTDGGADADGLTSYTFAADGRIVRDDYIRIIEPTGSNKWLVSYSTVDPSQFSHVSYSGTTGSGTYELVGGGQWGIEQVNADGMLSACVYDQGSSNNAIAWSGMSRGDVGTDSFHGLRMTDIEYANRDHALALQADLLRNSMAAPGVYHAASIVVVDPTTTDTCERALRVVHSYVADQMPVYGGTGVDGSQYVARQSSSAYPIDVTGPGTATVAVPGLDMDTALVALRDVSGQSLQLDGVSVDGTPLTEGVDYLVQDAMDPGADVRWVLMTNVYVDVVMEFEHSRG